MPRTLAGAGRHARLLRLSAVLVVMVGYVDLIRGGLTLAPLALVVGYLVLAPASLLVD
jgi:hypothetical protein